MQTSSPEDEASGTDGPAAGGGDGPDTGDVDTGDSTTGFGDAAIGTDTESTVEDEVAEAGEGGRSRLRVKLLPWPRNRGDADSIDIVVYVVTGWHGILPIPTALCRECHMFTRRADMAAEQVDVAVNVTVRSWWTHLPWARRNGWDHAPVMVVDGKRLCQGEDVPTTDEVVGAIERSVGEKGTSGSS